MKWFRDEEADEERDERESKTFRVIRGCFKGVLYGASALVWILVLIVVFTTREADVFTDMYFTNDTKAVAEQTKDYQVYQLNLQDFMNVSGNITIKNIWYAPETGELEFGVRYNKKLTDGETKDPIEYILTDQDDNRYQIVGYHEDAIGRYGYARICFTGVKLPMEDAKEEDESPRFILKMKRRSDGEPLATSRDENREIVDDATFCLYTPQTLYKRVPFDA